VNCKIGNVNYWFDEDRPDSQNGAPKNGYKNGGALAMKVHRHLLENHSTTMAGDPFLDRAMIVPHFCRANEPVAGFLIFAISDGYEHS